MTKRFAVWMVVMGCGTNNSAKPPTDAALTDAATLTDAPAVTDTAAAPKADGAATGPDQAAIADGPREPAGGDPADLAPDSASAGRDGPALGRDAAADGAPDLGRDGAAGPGPDSGPAPGPEAGPDRRGGDAGAGTARASVLQHHNRASRDGLFLDPALTRVAIAGLHMDPAFAGATVSGPTYAQPLYLAGAGGGPDLVIVATEQNHVYAFDAGQGGKALWDQTLGMPLPRSRLSALRQGCGNIDPLGVTGTPVIDAATRTVYLDAMTVASADATAQHQVFALDADTGSIRSGWPVDLNSKVSSGGTAFNSLVQNQRGALALLGGKVFIPFGGHIGDCADYHGWIVGISTSDPTQVSAWATRALAGGVWAPGGISSDGESLFFATGNTENQANTFSAPSTWQDGETIFRLPPSLTFSGQAADYFTPSNWQALDTADTDLGGTAPIVLDVAGATPSKVVVGLGKDGNAYLLDRANFGGIGSPTVLASVSSGSIITAAAGYTTPQGTYVAFKGTGKNCPSGQSGGVAAFKVAATSPPAVSMAWCGGPTAQASVAVSATDGQGSDAVVWIVGSDNKLYALNGDTGQTLFAGGSTGDAMSSVQKFIPPIIANGRVFVAANTQVYAFTP